MLIKSNTGSNCIPPLRNSINDENFDDIVYGDEDKWMSFLKECNLNYFQNFLLQFFSCYLLYFYVFYIV
jgi:hypothetical protein